MQGNNFEKVSSLYNCDTIYQQNMILNVIYTFQQYLLIENLLEEPDQPFNPHPEIGKYFKLWTGRKYIPNEYLNQKYPEDYQQD